MKRIISAILCVLIMFVLQSTVFSNINIAGVIPNLLIIITACWGFMDGSFSGLCVGFACGILMDVFFGSFLGFYGMIYMYIGYLNGKFVNWFMADDLKLPIIMISISDLTYGLLTYVFLFLLRGRFDFKFYLGHIILPELLATMIMCIVIYPLMLLIYKKCLVEKK